MSNPNPTFDPENVYPEDKVENEVEEKEEELDVCPECHGDGVIVIGSYDHSITKPCICQLDVDKSDELNETKI